MKILVTFAVDAEFAPWRRLCEFGREMVGAVPAYVTRIDSVEVRVVLTGIGPRNATRAVRATLAPTNRPDICISAGLAGGLRPEHRLGQILAARTISLAGSDAIIQSDLSLFQFAVLHGAKPVARFCTSEKLAQTAREKTALGAAADAVEMESFAVLAEAARFQVPAVAIRVVSDAVENDLPCHFAGSVNARGEISVPRLWMQIARRPHRLPALLRFGRESRRVAASLAAFLHFSVVKTLAARAGEKFKMVEEVAAT